MLFLKELTSLNNELIVSEQCWLSGLVQATMRRGLYPFHCMYRKKSKWNWLYRLGTDTTCQNTSQQDEKNYMIYILCAVEVAELEPKHVNVPEKPLIMRIIKFVKGWPEPTIPRVTTTAMSKNRRRQWWCLREEYRCGKKAVMWNDQDGYQCVSQTREPMVEYGAIAPNYCKIGIKKTKNRPHFWTIRSIL